MTTSTPSAPRRLRGPMFIPPETFIDATAELQPRLVGALVILGMAFWRDGILPDDQAELGRILGCRGSRAAAMAATLRPFFESGGLISVLRSAAVSKSIRRGNAGRLGAAALHGKSGSARPGRSKGVT